LRTGAEDLSGGMMVGEAAGAVEGGGIVEATVTAGAISIGAGEAEAIGIGPSSTTTIQGGVTGLHTCHSSSEISRNSRAR